jgi:hypothetical protein
VRVWWRARSPRARCQRMGHPLQPASAPNGIILTHAVQAVARYCF